MEDAIRLLAGDCTITYDGTDTVRQRGVVTILVKPDDTVLVHDDTGYQPAAWLTRADTVRVQQDDPGFELFASKDTATLHIEAHTSTGDRYYPSSPAGSPLTTCPDCRGSLIETTAAVVCTGCHTRYNVPRDATILETTCPDCSRPQMHVERGASFDVCIDVDCESLVDVVATQFDEAWPCPTCRSGMTITRSRGLRAVCDACDDTVSVPRGTVTGQCPCGLPLFASTDVTRCFDPACEAATEPAP